MLAGAREYHVQFFSNQPERAWVHEKRVREYKGHKQYEELLAEATRQASNHSEKQKVTDDIEARSTEYGF